MSTIESVLPSLLQRPLFGIAEARRLESAAAAALPPHTLMRRAGVSVARLALAMAPHAQQVCVLAGPGNNGGDGLEAAMHLALAGRQVQVLLTAADASALPEDAARSLARAQQAGVTITQALPERIDAGLLIDALLGLGARRAPQAEVARAIELALDARSPVLAVDLPSGLHAEYGAKLGALAVKASHTLSLLALKPGLFTGEGRELSGRIWHDDIGVDAGLHAAETPLARLGRTVAHPAATLRGHAQHKGSFGDVLVIGGASGMVGAARLAARAALAAGAGRVYLSPLDPAAAGDDGRPELMHRAQAWNDAALLGAATIVCGCGGGTAVQAVLPDLLAQAPRLVLDADALNAIAADAGLQQALAARRRAGQFTVITPHPLEAARLLGRSTVEVQRDRLNAALQLAARFDAAVVLKGSGSVIATPGRLPVINATGNALLATAGTGDVLAGWLGGTWAQDPGDHGESPAIDAVRLHGEAADAAALQGHHGPLRAADLIEAMFGLG